MYNPIPNYGINLNLNPIVAPRMEIPQVSGEGEARSYQMGPSSSVLLLDRTQPLVWVVQTDETGNKTSVAPFTITPYEPEPVPDIKGLEERFTQLEERMSKFEELMK